ncbi:hypothetical protein Acel_2036 [Acidothermus cellulolyticus 11B]|uniref:Uncharacterized protein n=1 Tax=Acidothermus cellulolyticus (strain ATCC 43068 / DSM 8971 / 11B) TaxID=351607 RepID=A0LWJ8_ACIC1|nr:hypothetical protein [Acidothermus cellulolyticus]ABK53808.1 hypothetical protein Acel_2036 [Acidothermus cellulolyticus 11B]
MTEPLHDVQLLRIPVLLHAQAGEHSAELLREMYLIAEQLGEHDGVRALPKRLIDLIDELTGRYVGFTREQDRLLDEARVSGAAEIDVHYRVPADVADAAVHLGELLDEADEYCRQGQHLLTLATPPELVHYRHWFLGEFSRQIGGAAPTPWPAYRAQGR